MRDEIVKVFFSSKYLPFYYDFFDIIGRFSVLVMYPKTDLLSEELWKNITSEKTLKQENA